MYFGSDGLLTFDGSKWQQFPMNGAYALRGLDFGKGNKLWAGAMGEIGWYSHESTGAWTYHSLLSKLPPGNPKIEDIWHVLAQGEGALFVGAECVYQWDGSKFRIWPLPTERHLEATRVGTDIYVYHAPTGLYLFDREGMHLVVPSSLLGKSSVMGMDHNSNGLVLITTKGMFTYSNGQLLPYAPEASEFIRKNLLTCAAKLPDGSIALGTHLGGIGFVTSEGNLKQTRSESDGLPTNSIFSLFVDKENLLWATSEYTIFNLSLNNQSTFYNQSPGQKKHPFVRITRSEKEMILAGPNEIYSLDPDTGIMHPFAAPVINVCDLQTMSDTGTVYAAVSGWIKKISDGKMSSFVEIAHNALLVKSSRRWPGHLLVASENSILLLDQNGGSRVLVKNLPDFIFSIAEDASGRLWLASYTHGIFVASVNDTEPAVEAATPSPSLGLPSDLGAASVAPGANGTVVAFTDSGGFFLGPKNNKFIPIENCPSRAASALSDVSPDGSFWAIQFAKGNQPASVGRIAVEGDRAVWQPHSVDGLWNIGKPQCIYVEGNFPAETTLWIGGTYGVMRNVVQGGPRSSAPGAPVLRGLFRSENSGELQSITHSLPYSARNLVFEFADPEYARRPALRLETRLDGVDQQWKPADGSAQRELTALREGHYTFRVRTVAETGIASPETVSEFEILPPWWRTGGAFLGAFLVLIPTAYGVYRWRVQLLKQRNVELERKVHERTEQLEKASAAKTQFVANMSHDIRNPLNGIVGLALALEDTWLDVKQRELVSTLRECTTYLSTLVDDVLDFATIEAGKIELRPAPFSPSELLKAITMMFKMEAISSGGVLTVEADPKLPKTYVGDAGRIQQVLVNFVSNALKYSGGPITLGVSIPEDAPEEIEFSVTDQGPGISEEGQRQLFTKFTRLTNSQSHEITGTGLGLASCRLLAGLMSGSVGVRSHPGHGARFYLRLPLDIFPTPAPDAPAKPMAVPILPNCNVLLVEDTNYNAMAAAAVLGKFGLSCERACSGTEALKLFAEKRHNLILLDRNLPDMDGTEVARRIRALEANGPRTIILAVTAYCTMEDRALCLNAGMDAFVGKPLTPQKLRRVLTAAGRRHLAAASMHVSPDVVSPAIDVSLLEYISDGSGQGLNRQIELFLTALGEAEKQLDQAAREVDFKMLAEAAHGVISHARLVGSASLATAAAGLQTAANAHDRDAFGGLLVRVKREIETLTALVRRHPGAERPA